MKKVVILIGGAGSNAVALIQAIQTQNLPLHCTVISHRRDALGLQRVAALGVPTAVVDHRDQSTQYFEQALLEALAKEKPELIMLAGFMRVLSGSFISDAGCPILNIHPSLLPLYKGLHTHERVLAAGDANHGATVHLVSSELDAGPIIAQIQTTTEDCSTARALQQKILKLEHRLYPTVLSWFAQDLLVLQPNHATFKGKLIPNTGILVDYKGN